MIDEGDIDVVSPGARRHGRAEAERLGALVREADEAERHLANDGFALYGIMHRTEPYVLQWAAVAGDVAKVGWVELRFGNSLLLAPPYVKVQSRRKDAPARRGGLVGLLENEGAPLAAGEARLVTVPLYVDGVVHDTAGARTRSCWAASIDLASVEVTVLASGVEPAALVLEPVPVATVVAQLRRQIERMTSGAGGC